MTAAINEIFKSIQGEGKYIGVPMVFIRFAGCDLGCSWCDTDHSVNEELTVDEVFERVQGFYEPGCIVSLTGGEPLQQWEFIKELLPLLKQKWMRVLLETNGIFFREFEYIRSGIDIVSMDFKLPSSTGCRACWAEHREMLSLAIDKELFIKIVVTKGTLREEMKFAAEMIASVDSNIVLYLQPNTEELQEGSFDRAVALQGYALEFLRDVRVVPQVHRLLGIK